MFGKARPYSVGPCLHGKLNEVVIYSYQTKASGRGTIGL